MVLRATSTAMRATTAATRSATTPSATTTSATTTRARRREPGQAGDDDLHHHLGRPVLVAPQVEVGGRQELHGPCDPLASEPPVLIERLAGLERALHPQHVGRLLFATNGNAVELEEPRVVPVQDRHDLQRVSFASAHHA